MAEANLGSLEFLAIWLPVSVGEQLYHALLRRAGCRTYPPCESAASQLDQLAQATLPPAFLETPPDLAVVFARFDAAPK